MKTIVRLATIALGTTAVFGATRAQMSMDMVVATSNLLSIGQKSSGIVSLVHKADGRFVLNIRKGAVEGPGLHVWLLPNNANLAKGMKVTSLARIDLGDFKGGDQEFNIPKGVDPAIFSQVGIICTTVDLPFAGTKLMLANNKTQTLKNGRFYSLEAPTMGNAVVVRKTDGKTVLQLQDFKTEIGPGLQVWLYSANAPQKGTQDIENKAYLNLGELKSFNGNFEFVIPAGTDLSKYKSIVLWCATVATPFGAASLN